jgi:endonuclease/exonuclease/phosphatase family metal-dependent hydrolase
MLLASYNIQYGLGADGRYDVARVAGEVARADVIALQEVERFWKRSGMIDEPAAIAALLPDHHWVFGANLDMDASFRDGGGKPVHRRRQFGTMILSRFPIVSSRNFPLPKHGDLSRHSIQQGLLEAVIDPGSGPLRIYSVHLSHLAPETRLPQIEAVLDILRRAPLEGGAWCGGHPDPAAGWTEGEMPPMPREHVLMGDLNFDQASAEYARMIGPVSPRYGRLVNRDGLVDAWVAAGNAEAEGRTHPRHRRIDHCFVWAPLAPRVRRVWVDEAATGSDHWPLFVELD